MFGTLIVSAESAAQHESQLEARLLFLCQFGCSISPLFAVVFAGVRTGRLSFRA